MNFTSYALVNYIIGRNTWHMHSWLMPYIAVLSLVNGRAINFRPTHSLHALPSPFLRGVYKPLVGAPLNSKSQVITAIRGHG